ncbi:hypothetical protein Dimus_012074 [Dionaea muscipula]
MSDDGGKGKKVAFMGISSLLLVAMVVAVSVGTKSDGKKDGEISSSTRTVEAICQPTDFKDTCISSLSSAAKNTSDPKELVKASFEVAINEINNVMNNSTLFKELEKNPETKRAADDCKELFNDATDDFRRSFNEVGQFEFKSVDKILSNLKVWLSATITYQETCLDGFENTTGDASEKMRELLKTSMELSSNGLAIVAEMSTIITSMQFTSFQRRLLSASQDSHGVLSDIDTLIRGRRLLASRRARDDDDNDDDVHGIIKGRRLLSMSPSMSPSMSLPIWLDEPRSKLLHGGTGTLMDAKPNVTVAKDGTGDYTTIAEALTEVPKWNNDTFVIYIKEGVYYEYLRVEKWLTNVVFIGDGPTKTRISGNLNYIDGTPTFKTATLSVLADNFMAKDIGVENTAGANKHQAVAIRVQADKTIFYNCQFDGYQDTLYAHTYRQFYRDCTISGTIDFVFGDAASFFQNCTFVVRKPLENQNCIVTAQGRKERHQPSGIIIHKSLFTSDPEYYPVRFTNKAYLARPWKEFSKTIIMESYLEDLIQPEGWLPWLEDFGLNTCYYGEYNNAGPGSNMTLRAKWRGVKTIIPSRAEKFMPPTFFGFDAWIVESGVPYIPNLTTAPPPEAATLSSDVDEDPNAQIAPAPSEDSSSSSSSKDSKSKSDEKKSKSSKSKSDTIALPPSISPAPAPSPSPISSETQSFFYMSSTEKASQQQEIRKQSEEGEPQIMMQSLEIETSQQPQVMMQSLEIERKKPRAMLKNLERVLIEDGAEDTDMAHNDDMMGNIPDGDEASPARVDIDSPAQAPSDVLGVAPSANEPSQAPAQEIKGEAGKQPQIMMQSLEVETSQHPQAMLKDLERVLMEDGAEDTDMANNDDMTGNIPDGDETSPARVDIDSPAQAPSDVLGVAPSANEPGDSVAQSPNSEPSQAPAQEDGVADMYVPASSPGSNADAADDIASSPPAPEPTAADTVPPPKPAESGSSKTTYGVQIILSGFAIWAALAM